MKFNTAKNLDSFMKKYTPDPFIYALLLTLIVLLFSVFSHNNNPAQVVRFWGDGFWSLSVFTMQMVMVLFLGYVAALSAPIKKILNHLASLPKTLPQAAAFTTLIALTGCWLNWGFGLIISALFCKELGQKFSGRGFSILVACSYSGFLIWHGGLSGSIPLVINTPGNFSEALLGGLVPLSLTIFSSLNISILISHFIILPLLAYYLMSISDSSRPNIILEPIEPQQEQDILTPAAKLENSPLLSIFAVLLAGAALAYRLIDRGFSIDLDTVNFIFFILAILLHKNPKNFLDACQHASGKIWPILIQYPFYAGIMAIMQKSGLADTLSHAFVDIATQKTLPVLVFFSAGLVNIFIPSGGGQWAVQGPMVIQAAQELGANLNSTIMAVAWGDAWTNMIQPFWALPLLAVAGLKARDIMGTLVFVLITSGLIISTCFVLLA